MNSKTIEKDGDLYGFYNDLVEMLKSELLGALEDKGAPDAGALGQYSEIFEELTKLKEYDGIIKISECNGMGWTAEKVTSEKPKSYKLAADFFADAGAIMAQKLDSYTGELVALRAVYKHGHGVNLYDEDIEELKNRAEKIAEACTDMLEK